MKFSYYSRIGIFIVFSLLYGCATISNFDQYAYTQATSIKVDAMNTMSLATDKYADHLQEIANVQTEMNKLYEYEKNRPKNTITTKMWEKMIDTSGHLYGGFIQHWKSEKKLRPAFIENEKELIAKSFDQIAELESKKIKQSSITNNN
ncbi:MAG TPA: hypothetical protein VMU83_05780 [Hanamia sp.]|nr:hypothetical protein [Hanamia sp.]